MYFQIFDAKRECKNVLSNGVVENSLKSNMTHTWSFSPHLRNKKVYYAEIWSRGMSLNDACPEYLKNEWQALNLKSKAFIKSIKISKVDLNHNCLFELLPRHFLIDFYSVKNKITEHVFNTTEKPLNYYFLSDLCQFLYDISQKNLNLNFDNLEWSDKKTRDAFNKIKNVKNKIDYSPWITATGRLSTKPNSFPILNLNKELRSCIEPTNDLFIELDYNAAEIRVLFALLEQEQPANDLHEWIGENIFDGKYKREQVKKKVFSWLYNPKAKNKKLNEFLCRQDVLDKYYNGQFVETPYDRRIEVDQERALNYVIQSTASDLFLTSAMKIDKMLQEKKSFVAFCVHDSLVLDVSIEDKAMLNNLAEQFSKTKLGDFKTNISIGKNYGSMKRVK